MATLRKPSKRPNSGAAQAASARIVYGVETTCTDWEAQAIEREMRSDACEFAALSRMPEQVLRAMPKRVVGAAREGPYAEPICRVRRRAKKATMDMCTSYQDGLHNISQDIQDAWYTVFNTDDNQATIRVSWRSCWGRLQSTLLAVFHEALSESSSPDSMPGLSKESWKNLTNVLGALKAKMIHHHTETELHNQSAQLLACFKELVQATSDVSTWHRLLDDLIMDTNDDPACRNAKADLIEENLDGANQALREIAKRAQQLVVPV